MTTEFIWRSPRNLGRAADLVVMSYGDVPVLAPRPLDLLVARLLDALDDHVSRLRRIDHVVDHRPTRRQVRVDLRADGVDQLRARRFRLFGCLDLLVED